jgi:methionine synthase II (cobalamin-independent)
VTTNAGTPAQPGQPQEVFATGLGGWPGTDMPEAVRITRGELGHPHLPYLPELPDRGVGADPIGRTAAILVELPVDVQPFGWRLVDRPGADHRRAVSLLNSDINVLADMAGAEEQRAPALKVQLTGPLTLAASIFLHQGERALLDYGARRDVADSLAAGLAAHVAKLREAVPGARLMLQLNEPEVVRVLAGTIPTASGYHTLRAVSGSEVLQVWQRVIDAARRAGVAEVVLSLPGSTPPLQTVFDAGADGVALPLATLGTADWEHLAVALEAGRQLWAGVLPVRDGVVSPPVSKLVETILRPWRGIGLTARGLAAVRLTPATGLEVLSPAAARAALTVLTDTARALNDVMAD